MDHPAASAPTNGDQPADVVEQIEAMCLTASQLQDSDPKASMSAADKALSLLSALGEAGSPRRLWSKALRYAGVSRVILGLFEEALPLLFRAISAARRAGSASDEAAGLNAVGQALNRSGEYEGALSYLFEYLEKALQSGNRQDTCRALINIGNVYFELQDYPAALRKYHQAQETWPGDAFSNAILLNNIGGTLSKQGAWHEAEVSLRLALDHVKEAGSRPLLESGILSHLGTVHGRLRRVEEAKVSLASALALARSSGGFRQEVGALTEIGRLELATGDSVGAIETLNEALEISVRAGLRSCEGEVCELLSSALEAEGMFDLALVHERRSAAIAQELHQGRSERRARALQIVLELNWPAEIDEASSRKAAARADPDSNSVFSVSQSADLDARAPLWSPSAATTALSTLTPREREIVSYLRQGLSNKAIARMLSISGYTVRHHVSTILRKLGARTRAQVVAMSFDGSAS